MAKEADLRPEHLSLVPLALWNAWAGLRRGDAGEGVVLIDVGATRTRICFLKNGFLQFYREVSPGGTDMTEALAEALVSEVPPENLAEEAERMKRAMGARMDLEGEEDFVPPSPLVGDATEERRWSPSQLRSASFRMRPLLERLASEIHRSIDYFQSHSSGTRVKEVLLTGGGAKMEGLATFLANELALPVELLNPLSAIPFDPQHVQASRVQELGPQFAVAFGLALPPQVEIELLPRREPFGLIPRLRARLTAFSILSALVSGLTLGGFGWIAWKMDQEARSLQRELETRSEKTRNLETLRAKIAFLKEKEAKLKGHLPFLPELKTPSPSHGGLLQAMSEVLPGNVTLTLISLKSRDHGQGGEKDSVPPSEGSSSDRRQEALHLSGLAFGSDLECLTALSQTVEGLERNRLCRNVRLLSVEEDKTYNQPAAQFELACDVEPLLSQEREPKNEGKKE